MSVYEADFSNFGSREIKMASELLDAYLNSNIQLAGAGMKVCLNQDSGYVFLSDEDYNTYMMNGDKLEQFFNCPECGHEGFREEFKDQECSECKEIFNREN